MENLSEQIKKIRKSKKITQEELAGMVGVSVITIKRWEKDRMPRANEMSKLAEALGTTVGALMGEGEPEASDEKENAKNLPIDNAPENENKIGMAYWGGIIDNAQKVAARGDEEEIALITPLLKSALKFLTGAGVNLAPQVVGVNGIGGNHNNVRGVVNVATA